MSVNLGRDSSFGI